MALRKLRGGATGAETAYSLTVVPLQAGSLGPAPTTCVVTWSGVAPATAPAPSKSRWPTSLRVFRSALTTALINHGQIRRPFGSEGPEVRTVAEEKVRAEFNAAYPVAGEISEERNEAKRKAYARALRSARERELIGSRDISGVDHLWLLDEPAEEDIHPDGRDTP